MVQQHMHMSLFCFQYLTSSAFDMVRNDSKTTRTHALTGFYGFFDYAAAHWDYHSFQYVRQASLRPATVLAKEELDESLSTAWMKFVKRFCNSHEPLLGTMSDYEGPVDNSVEQFTNPCTVDTEVESCTIQDTFRDWGSTRTSTEFQSLAKSIHHIMRQTYLGTLEDREKTVYVSLNGPFRSKCSRRTCVHFHAGFESEVDLSLHTSWHEMAYKCPHTGCYAWSAGFRTDASLQVHLKRMHPATDSEKELFPVKPRRSPRTWREACRLGDIESLRTFSIPMSTHEHMLLASRVLIRAVRDGHFSICVHLTQQGANPYISLKAWSFSSSVQKSIRLGDLDLFSALRSAAHEKHESAFIEEPTAFLECILEALESPIPQFIVSLFAWNSRRTVPLTLDTILLRGGDKTQLDTLLLSEWARYRKGGSSPEDFYEQVLIAPDAEGRSVLHRLCGGDPEYPASGAVKLLFTKLKPGDTRRRDVEGNPPLFTALKNSYGCSDESLDDHKTIIRSFFWNDLDGAETTRNASGIGTLEFAFRYATLQIFSLVFELCGADYRVLHSLHSRNFRPGYTFEQILEAVGIVGKSRMAAELSPEQAKGFADLLLDLDIEPESLDVLMHHQPQSVMRARHEPFHDASDTLRAILQPGNPSATKFLSNLKGAERFFEKHQSHIGTLGLAELRKLLFVCLEPEAAWYDTAKTLLTDHNLDLDNIRPEEYCPDIRELAARQGMDPEVISLLKRYEGYREYSFKEMQDQVIQTLGDSSLVSETAGARSAEGLTDYVQSLIQNADPKRDREFVTSLEYIRRCLQ